MDHVVPLVLVDLENQFLCGVGHTHAAESSGVTMTSSPFGWPHS